MQANCLEYPMNKKKVHRSFPLSLLVIISFAFLLSSCYTLYTASEGEVLLQYGEPEALKELTINPDPDILIIDVRPENAYQRGHIPTALNYPSSDFQKMLDQLSKESYLILYCETGGRAQAVINKLEDKGYTRMLNWGGYTRWPYQR